MKPTFHGIEQLDKVVVTNIPSDKVDIKGLIQMFEANLDKAAKKDWLHKFKEIVPIYKAAFTLGELPEQMLSEVSYELLEMAEENIGDELSTLINGPAPSSGKDYYYEFARSIGVEAQASKLEEYLDEDCDFI